MINNYSHIYACACKCLFLLFLLLAIKLLSLNHFTELST